VGAWEDTIWANPEESATPRKTTVEKVDFMIRAPDNLQKRGRAGSPPKEKHS